jgi:hypothetical protein
MANRVQNQDQSEQVQCFEDDGFRHGEEGEKDKAGRVGHAGIFAAVKVEPSNARTTLTVATTMKRPDTAAPIGRASGVPGQSPGLIGCSDGWTARTHSGRPGMEPRPTQSPRTYEAGGGARMFERKPRHPKVARGGQLQKQTPDSGGIRRCQRR